MKRVYEAIIKEHFKNNRQMLFFVGPRQAGKTTVSLTAKKLTDSFAYLNWDNLDQRSIIIEGVKKTAEFIGLNRATAKKPIVVFDEIHKYSQWKNFLKGFFDTYQDQVNIIVTGSARLDLYRKGGDSLMGRYFPYRLHPLTVAELKNTSLSDREIHKPKQIQSAYLNRFIINGGFPEPFLKNNKRFLNQWKGLRFRQLVREDIRDLSRVQEVGQIELLAEFIRNQSAAMLNYTSLSRKVNVSVDTIRRWVQTLRSFFYCFTLQPWSKNISRSLTKEPKIYLWDYSSVQDKGARFENLVACHLLKAVHFWTDRGLGDYNLWFIRDKEKREVDFLVTRDAEPWFLVEAKLSARTSIDKNLFVFQDKIKAQHAFQVVSDMPYVAKDCFSYTQPTIVPVLTFLSQLV